MLRTPAWTLPPAALLVLVALLTTGSVGCYVVAGTAERWDSWHLATSEPLPENVPEELAVVSYNTFLRPGVVSMRDHTVERAALIAEELVALDADLVALQEVWHGDALQTLIAGTEAVYPHRTVRKPARAFLEVSGGLALLSRSPLADVQTLKYDTCHGIDDCRAAKGLLYARAQVGPGAFVQIVTTHLDAGMHPGDRAARATQLDQVQRFLSGLDPARGPLILLGDFNVDGLADDGEYAHFVHNLALHDALPMASSTTNPVGPPGIRCDGEEPPKRIDYILTRADERRLAHRATQHLPLATDAVADGVCFLSDHRLVASTFTADFGTRVLAGG